MTTVRIYLNQAVYQDQANQDAIDGWYAFDSALREVTPIVKMAVTRSENNYRENDPMTFAWEGEVNDIDPGYGDVEVGTLETAADLYYSGSHEDPMPNARTHINVGDVFVMDGTAYMYASEGWDRLDYFNPVMVP